MKLTFRGLLAALVIAITQVAADMTNLRIQYNYIPRTGQTTLPQSVLDCLEAAKLFASNLIKVNTPASTSDYIKPQQSSQCGGISYSQDIYQNGVSGVDLYILVIDVDQVANPPLVVSGSYCDYPVPRPRFGYLKLDAVTQASAVAIVQFNLIEQLRRAYLNILGFDSNMFGSFSGVGDPNTLYNVGKVAGRFGNRMLSLPNTVKAVQAYFGCSDSTIIQGGPVEDISDGTSRTFSSWETTLLAEDIMSSTPITAKSTRRLRFSALDVALLKDSGFYPFIDETMIEPMAFGQGKGCNFFAFACQTTNPSSEYCVYGNSYGKNKCNVDQTMLGVCTNNKYQNGCSIYSDPTTDGTYCATNQSCFDFEDDYTYDSQCYDIKILQTSNSAAIQLSDPTTHDTYVCSTDGQFINPIKRIRCPSSIKTYIANLQIDCPNSCNGKGYCNNGTCYCIKGYYGNDCVTVDNTQSVQFAYLLNFPASATLSTCPLGYSIKLSIQTPTKPSVTYNTCGCSLSNKCAICDRFACLQCDVGFQLTSVAKLSYCVSCNGNGITNCAVCTLDETVSPIVPNVCTQCMPGFFLNPSDKKCYANCATGQYLDTSTTTYTCKPCLPGCTSCLSLVQCQSCQTGYSYNLQIDFPLSQRICYIQCPTNQAAIQVYTDQKFNVCQDCSEGTGYQHCVTCHFVNTSKNCDTCKDNFKVSTLDNKCSVCADTFFLTNDTCSPCTQNHCIQCSSANVCILCETGYYVLKGACVADCGLKFFGNSSGQCEACISDCDICTNNSDCIVCGNGKYYDNSKATLGCTNSSTSCHSSCDRCSKPKGPIDALPTDSLVIRSSCYTCLNSQVLTPIYQPGDQPTFLKSLQYYGTCSSFCYENQLSQPQPKYETTYKLCEYCDINNLCKKCNQTGGCAECINPSKYFLDPDTLTCVPWDNACLTQDISLGCLSCYNPMYVGFKNTCIKQCPENYDTITTSTTNYCSKINCFHSCSTCIGTSYNECVTCPQSRVLEVYHGSFSGQCSCKDDSYTDTFSTECASQNDELNYKISTYFFTSSAFIASVVSSALLSNPISFFFLADHAQSAGQLTYIDKQNSYGLDTSMAAYKYFNLNILIPSPIVNQKLEQQRVLEGSLSRMLSTININQFRSNQNYSKIVDYHNSNTYLYSGFWSFIVLSIVWIIKAIGHILLSLHEARATPGGVQVDTPKPPTWLYILEEYFMGLIPLGVFILTCSELSLVAFVDFRDSSKYIRDSTDAGFNAVSVVFSALYLLFSFVYILYLIFSTKDGIVYSLFDDTKNGSVFFFILLAVKKFIQSALLVFLEGSSIGQTFSVTIVEAIFIFYLIYVRPFKRETYYNLIYIIGEFIIFIVTIIYTVMSFTTDSSVTQNNCAQAIMIFLILLMTYSIICSIFLAIFFFVRCCRKQRPSHRLTAPASHDGKLQTEFGIMKDLNEIELHSAKNMGAMETHNPKNQSVQQLKLSQKSEEELNEAPSLFIKNKQSSGQKFLKQNSDEDKSANSPVEQQANEIILEEKSSFNPPMNSRRGSEKQHQKSNDLIFTNENFDDNDEIGIKASDNKANTVHIFDNKDSKKVFKSKDLKQSDHGQANQRLDTQGQYKIYQEEDTYNNEISKNLAQ